MIYDSVTLAQLTKLFVLHVFSKHGVLMSPQGSKDISNFFRSPDKVLDMCLHFTSGYHPEGDSQNERIKYFEPQ